MAKQRGIVKECEVLLKFWWRCSLSLESISLTASLACPHRPGDRMGTGTPMNNTFLSGKNLTFLGDRKWHVTEKQRGGKHVQNFLFWTGPYEVMSYKGLGAGRWEHFPLWDTWPGNAWPGPVCVIYENNLSFQVEAVWFNSSSQLMLSTGQVCGLFCHP